MSETTQFDQLYNERFSGKWEFERTTDGILTVRFKQPDSSRRDAEGYSIPSHNANPLTTVPGLQASSPVWSQIGNDPENKVVILTGYDGVFYNSHEHHFRQGYWDATVWHSVIYNLPRAVMAFLDLPTLSLGAAIGEATVHAEFLLLCDIVVAGESAVFQDKPHFKQNTVPGDGVNVFWPLFLGWNRGRDFLLTGRKIDAYEALELGLVREVVPDDQVLPRCHELARELLEQDELTLRYTAPALRQQLKVQVLQYMQASLGLEGIVFMDQSSKRAR